MSTNLARVGWVSAVALLALGASGVGLWRSLGVSGTTGVPNGGREVVPPQLLRGHEREQGFEIRGRVIAGHEPASHATISVTSLRGSADLIRTPESVVVADAAGRFLVHGLTAGRHVVSALAAGWAPSHLAVEVPLEGSSAYLEIRLLRRGVRLHGSVNDNTGGPVLEGRILISSRDVAGPPPGTAVAPVQTGRYDLRLPPGLWTLQVEAPGYARRRISVVLQDDQQLDIQLTPGAMVLGRVLLGGAPIGGAGVELLNEHRNGMFRSSTSNEDGEFSFSDLPPGRYRLQARHGTRVSAPSPWISVTRL